MNANFGIVICKESADALLSRAESKVVSWGESFSDEASEYENASLPKIRFQLFPMTEFVMSKLPSAFSACELVYAWMTGSGLDSYEDWVCSVEEDPLELHPFEAGLMALVEKAKIAAIMFAPEGERLDSFLPVDIQDIPSLLRRNIQDINGSSGFLAWSIS